MSSIATKKGDGGQTSLTAESRLQVIDSCRAMARLTKPTQPWLRPLHLRGCRSTERTKLIQRELFKVGSAIATPRKNARANLHERRHDEL